MVKDFKNLLSKYPVISWIVVGFVAFMLVISTVGFGFMGFDAEENVRPDPVQSNDPEDAKADLERCLAEVAKDPSDFNYRQLARAYMATNEIDKALEAAQTAVSKDPNDVSSYQLLCEVYNKQSWCEITDKDLIDIKPIVSADKLAILTGMKDKKYPVDQFLEELKKANFKQEEIQSLTKYVLKNNDDRILESMNKIVSLDPNNLDSRFNLASFLIQCGKAKEAIPELKKILETSPTNLYAHQFLAIAYMNENIYDKAEEEFNYMLKQQPDDVRIHSALGEIYLKQKRYNDAVAIYEKAITLDPNRPFLFAGLGGTYAMQGKNEKAVENYKKALSLDPNSIELHSQLATLYQKMGKQEEFMNELKSMNIVQNVIDANSIHVEPVETKVSEPEQGSTGPSTESVPAPTGSNPEPTAN
ncbi:MAG: tetratricopeptide repeat protein [Candidatus Eremiobacterota bacterium]